MMTNLKALTVCQGWASAMFLPTPKDVENRTWETNYRGDLLIHAGKSKKHLKDCADFCRGIIWECLRTCPWVQLLGRLSLLTARGARLQSGHSLSNSTGCCKRLNCLRRRFPVTGN
jgi:hypothetical protein